MKIKITKKEDKGFALLFSVLISSLLLTIGLSIFSIALKELAISSASRQSIHAFYAADSGRECALYWDTKSEKIPTVWVQNLSGVTVLPERDVSEINCNGLLTPTKSPDAQSPNTDVTTQFSFSILDADGPNTEVSVVKGYCPSPDEANICTSIIATGWDSPGGNRVEREIKESY